MEIARVITFIWIPSGGHDPLLIHMARVETSHANNISDWIKRAGQMLEQIYTVVHLMYINIKDTSMHVLHQRSSTDKINC